MKGQSQQAPGANPLGRSTNAPQQNVGGSDPSSSMSSFLGGVGNMSSTPADPGSSMGSFLGGVGNMGSGPSANPLGRPTDPSNPWAASSAMAATQGNGPVGAGASLNSFNGSLGSMGYPSAPPVGTPQAKSLTQTPPTPYSTMPQSDPASGTGSSANQIADPISAFQPANGPDPRQIQAFYSNPSNWSGTPIPGSAPASAAANPVGGGTSTNAGAVPNGPLSNEWGSVTGNVSPSGQIQNGINTGNVPGLVGGDALQGTMQQAQDAAYKNATGYLDPQWQNQQTTLQNQLANQGVMQNSEAWNKAMDDFGRQKQFAYQQAQSNAVNQGLAAQGQLFNQGLQANQNAFGQNLAQGQFGNAAQQQGYQENLSNANFANSAQNQIATQGLQNRQIASQLEGQRYSAQAAGAAASAQAAASMSNVQAQIQAQQQQNQFNNSLSLRNQGINELLLQQQNPLQMMNQLSGGQGVSQPNFTSAPGANVGGTDIMQAIQNAYQGQLGGYNAQTGASNSNNAAMASIIAAMICDRRLKKNIRKIGMLTSGCALYEFEYLWGEKAVGPMADEVELVRPDAVFTLSTGHKVVDVARL